MSKGEAKKESCFGKIAEKGNVPCCFSLPFQSHIVPCLYAFAGNSSDGFVEPPMSKSFQCSRSVSKSREDLHCAQDQEPQERRAMESVASRSAGLQTTHKEQEHGLLQRLWLEQQQISISTWPRKEEANFILDKLKGRKYRRGKLLGKGAFAKCYELTDLESCAVFAGKIIPKNRLSKPHQREKLEWEVAVHRELQHENVVAFFDYFEDDRNVYIILEHCRRKSLDHVVRVRKTLTEPEVRYYVRQLVEGCRYIHSQHIIHRDLKLGNMLLNGNMQVKIADFGLATRVKYDGEKKMGVCGTPNYVAPEVLKQEGHSYEVDLWSIGCIVYTMLCGRPPFEMPTLKETFKRISENKYSLPSHLSISAKDLIRKLLSHEPAARPSLNVVLLEDFFTTGYAPASLSPSFCERSPRFPTTVQLPRPRSMATTSLTSWKPGDLMTRKKLLSRRKLSTSQVIVKSAQEVEDFQNTETREPVQPRNKPEVGLSKAASTSQVCSLMSMYKQLAGCLQCIPDAAIPLPVTFHVPISVSKWIDYSNKYGFGVQLSDGSVGVNFNDSTRLILLANARTLEYINLSNRVRTYSVLSVPLDLRKKLALVLYFHHYMEEHLKSSVSIASVGSSGSGLALASASRPAVHLKRWFRTDEALILYLSNGTVQVNFLTDHTKLILGTVKGEGHLVTYINTKSQIVSYHLSQLCQSGCSLEISVRLRYARRMLETLINYEEEAV